MKPKLVVIIGPSGAGKSSVAKVLCDQYGFGLQKTVTTRPQRDEYDTDHLFVTDKSYQEMLDAHAFFGTLDIFGHRYGLPRFNPAAPTLLLLRAPAIEEFITMFPDAFIVEIDAPLEMLEARLRKRNSHDRINREHLEKEIVWGRSLAQYIADSSIATPEAIALAINEQLHA